MHKLYKPAGNYLLIKLDKSVEDINAEQGKSQGGIVIPASVKEGELASRPVLGTVVAAGPDASPSNNPLSADRITPGERVDFFLFKGFPRIIEGVHYVQINSNQILGIVGTPKIEVVASIEGDPIRN